MKYGDFSSLVQLGVGLHAGTALLQLYGEFGAQPLARSLARIRSLFNGPEKERPPGDIEQELEHLEGRYEIFKIRLFNEYKKFIVINSVVAVVLAITLTVIAFVANIEIRDGMEWTYIFMVFLSLFPAPSTLGLLWHGATRQLRPIKEAADELEKRALRVSGGD